MAGKQVSRIRSLLVVALLISLIVVMFPAARARAQFVTAPGPSITVYGTGTATAPAATALVQLVIGPGGREFGFSSDGIGSSSFESGGSVAETISALPEEAAGTPVAAEEGGRRGRRTLTEPTPITDERLEPIIAAITAAVSDAAAADGLVVEVAGVRYDPADCAALEEAAEQAAIAEARVRAERLARLLEVTLGDVVTAASDIFAVPDEDGCGSQEGYSYDSRQGGLGVSVPVFDPSLPAEVTVTARLTIGYAIVTAESG